MQTHPNDDLPIAYLSKKLMSTQMNRPETKQECYAILFPVENPDSINLLLFVTLKENTIG